MDREEFYRQFEAREQQKRQQEELRRIQYERYRAHVQAQEVQRLIDEQKPRKKIIIAAVDLDAGFAKDGKIPWHHKEDFKWFKNRTKGMPCVMGRTTYEDIDSRLNKKEQSDKPVSKKPSKNVLPGRSCFVVSSTLTSLPNATVVRSINEADNLLDDDEKNKDKPLFIIGGERLFREAIALADEVHLTVINKRHGCDKFFPVQYLQKHFAITQQFKSDKDDALRFLVWKRQG